MYSLGTKKRSKDMQLSLEAMSCLLLSFTGRNANEDVHRKQSNPRSWYYISLLNFFIPCRTLIYVLFNVSFSVRVRSKFRDDHSWFFFFRYKFLILLRATSHTFLCPPPNSKYEDILKILWASKHLIRSSIFNFQEWRTQKTHKETQKDDRSIVRIQTLDNDIKHI